MVPGKRWFLTRLDLCFPLKQHLEILEMTEEDQSDPENPVAQRRTDPAQDQSDPAIPFAQEQMDPAEDGLNPCRAVDEVEPRCCALWDALLHALQSAMFFWWAYCRHSSPFLKAQKWKQKSYKLPPDIISQILRLDLENKHFHDSKTRNQQIHLTESSDTEWKNRTDIKWH